MPREKQRSISWKGCNHEAYSSDGEKIQTLLTRSHSQQLRLFMIIYNYKKTSSMGFHFLKQTAEGILPPWCISHLGIAWRPPRQRIPQSRSWCDHPSQTPSG